MSTEIFFIDKMYVQILNTIRFIRNVDKKMKFLYPNFITYKNLNTLCDHLFIAFVHIFLLFLLCRRFVRFV